jgi:hypothetical protein
MICYFTASEEAKRVIRGDSANDTKMNGSDEQVPPASPREREGWETLLARFWQGEQEFCDERFKLIPSVVCLPLSPLSISPSLTLSSLLIRLRVPGW